VLITIGHYQHSSHPPEPSACLAPLSPNVELFQADMDHPQKNFGKAGADFHGIDVDTLPVTQPTVSKNNNSTV